MNDSANGAILTALLSNLTTSTVQTVLMNMATSLAPFLPVSTPASNDSTFGRMATSPSQLQPHVPSPTEPTVKLPDIYLEPELEAVAPEMGEDQVYQQYQCWASLSPENLDPITTAICASLILIGLLYILYGYRFFKAIMFATGFIFATTLVYLICIEEELLSVYGNICVSLSAGFLFGLITMLVGYVGLFVLGFHLGCLSGTSFLLASHLLAPYSDAISPPDSVWITFVTIMGSGLVGACSTLYFRKGSFTSVTTTGYAN